MFYFILGAYCLYTCIHFFVIQFTKPWIDRSGYEKYMTITTAVIFALLFSA